MKNKILSLYKKYEEYVNYFVVGVCTTLVSLVSKYLLLFTVLSSKDPFQLQLSVIISWILAVTFAYVTNRKFVFKSRDKNIFREMSVFFMARVSTLLAESLILWFFITLLGFDSNFYVVIWTLLSQVIIFIGNYILSKYIIFNKNSEKFFSKKNLYFIIFSILVLILSYLFPYTHDDWAWGTSIGIERLTSLFSDYNGRWLGNLFVLLLTRNRILRALIITCVLGGILTYINKILDFKNSFIKLLTIGLILMMPVSVLGEAVAWTSGFTNYVVVVLLNLIYLNYNNNYFVNQKEETFSYKNIIFYFIVGFSAALFVEHLTIYSVLVSITFVIIDLVKKKKISKINLSYMIGTILGTILMFSNDAYYNIANNEDSYRQIGQDNIIVGAIKTYFSQLYKYLFLENHFINIFVGVLILILLYKYLVNNNKIKNVYKKILNGISLFVLAFLCLDVYCIFINDITLVSSRLVDVLFGTIYGIYWVLIFLVILFLITDKKIRIRMIFELCSIVIMAAPLLVVRPIGPRCFFPTYIMFVIFAIELFNYVILRKIKIIDNFSIVLKFMCMLLLLVNISIYGCAFLVETQRKNYIDNNKNSKLLVLPEIPFDEYIQSPNPSNETFIYRFKLFYNIDNDVSISFVPYISWIK